MGDAASIMGGTINSAICFFIPIILYLKLDDQDPIKKYVKLLSE